MVYLPPAFTETRTELLIEHIERYDFGLLVSQGAQGLNRGMIASQVPFLVERRDGVLYLQGHLARANPQGADLDGNGEALAIFRANPDGAGIVQTVGPLKVLARPSEAAVGLPAQRFLIVTDLNDSSRVVLRQTSSPDGP